MKKHPAMIKKLIKFFKKSNPDFVYVVTAVDKDRVKECIVYKRESVAINKYRYLRYKYGPYNVSITYKNIE